VEVIDSFTVPVVSGTGGSGSVTSPTFSPEIIPPIYPEGGGVVVVTGQPVVTQPALPAASPCDRCSLRKGTTSTTGGGSVTGSVALTPGTIAGPLTPAGRAPLPWWVYVLVGFGVGRLFRG
jgi:hypothetical protein